ncbi:MAG: zinc-dependent metalloprotease [Oligoflexia bacterium]|nr:zinc-dependent metalloprotease [Oligoflexia bacterium]
MTFPKASILGREFTYTLDLQYSTVYDPHADFYNQTSVAASVPAHFQIVGNELQLLSIGSIKYPSDVNHPDELISRFTIVSEDDTNLEVSTANSGAYLAEQLGPADDSSKKLGYLDLWVRSAETAENGTLFMQQTSIQGEDGSISEFMESIFPRDVLTPGDQFQKIKMNPDDPTGGTTGIAARFRFLSGDTVFTGEDKHSFANHFDLSNQPTIDWYVTANAPDSVLPLLKEGVEAWNRYFTKMQGFHRDVLSFKGKLPSGIHIGDPRYNVIGWDDRQVAGAAYESQASDPESGVQSHSLIYMPAAWLAIGTHYWNTGKYTDGSMGDPGTSPTPIPPARLSLNRACSRDIGEGLATLTSGTLSADEISVFSKQLLKQVLFHEVGHALGLAHNFKASTEFDPTHGQTIFSSSIMDYNDYALERGAFDNVDSSDGPTLEYDRQILSVLYDNGHDIAATDRVMPACNDAEADNEIGGVDPICIRYDIGHDPTLEIQRAISRIHSAKIDGDVTLHDAIERISGLYFTNDVIASLTSDEAIQEAVKGFGNALTNSEAYFVGTSGQSLAGNLRLNLKSLREFGGAPLPSDYDAAAMRERVFSGVNALLNLKSMPTSVKDSLNAARDACIALVSNSPYMIRMPVSAKQHLLKSLADQVTEALTYWETAPTGLPALRLKAIAALTRHPADPFFLGMSETKTTVDYESAMVGVLGDIVTGHGKHTSSERIAAAKALATYSGRRAFETSAEGLESSLKQERATASTNDDMETVQAMLTALGWN